MLCRTNCGQNRKLCIIIFFEEWVLHGSFYCDSFGRLQMHHLCQKVHRLWDLCKIRRNLYKFFVSINTPFRECWLHIWQVVAALPLSIYGRSQNLKYLKKLTDFTFSIKKWFSVCKFKENAAKRPDIDCCAVNFLA